MWRNLRKTGACIHVGYGHSFSNNLLAYNTMVRGTDDRLELSIDLNPNLRVRDTGDWGHIDAVAVSENMDDLELVQLLDDHILEGLDRYLGHREPKPKAWVLQIELKGSHRFNVRPRYEANVLWLEVDGPASVES